MVRITLLALKALTRQTSQRLFAACVAPEHMLLQRALGFASCAHLDSMQNLEHLHALNAQVEHTHLRLVQHLQLIVSLQLLAWPLVHFCQPPLLQVLLLQKWIQALQVLYPHARRRVQIRLEISSAVVVSV